MSNMQDLRAMLSEGGRFKIDPIYTTVDSFEELRSLQKRRRDRSPVTFNFILRSDSYKSSHMLAYPPDTQHIYSYIESRGGKWDNLVFFGLQMFLKQLEDYPVTMDDIDEAEEFMHLHGEPFDRTAWEHIVRVHKGRLPISIHALPEGWVVRTKIPLVTIVNTDPACFWLSSYVETAILRAVWFPTTVATNSFQTKLACMAALEKSSDAPDAGLDYMMHDFSGRGVSSGESAAIGGCAHLVNFKGSDTVEGVLAARRFYAEWMAAHSVPAAEHSTITSWGADHEIDAYRNMLRRFAKPGTIVSIVSDSYDLMNAVLNIFGGVLKQELLDSGARLVVRPDSGDPTTIPVQVLTALAEKFGVTTNAKGYKVLPSCVRVLQGDGITQASLRVLLDNVLAAGFSAENILFGMGGGLTQMVTRDDLSFAMKCSAIARAGSWQDVFKAPKTDPGKRSKRGRFSVVEENGELRTVPLRGNEDRNELKEVWRDGRLLVEQPFTEVRARADAGARRLAAQAVAA